MSNLISLQGKFYLARIVAGVAGTPRHIGNVPDFEIETDAEILEHTESMTGNRTTDFTMSKSKSVKFKGTLDEVMPENLAYILDGHSGVITGGAVTGKSLGTVAVGVEIPLGGYNVTDVVIKDSTTGSALTVDPSKYRIDAAFGTVTFNDVTGLTMPLITDFTAGAASSVTINDADSQEYELTFRGINTVNNKKVEVKLWRTKKDPGTTFPLIHDEFGTYEINGSALSEISHAVDGQLGLYGRYVTIGE